MKTLAVDITFSRDYFKKHFGIDYAHSYFEDMRVRAETEQAAQKSLFGRLGDIGLGEPHSEPIVQLGYDDTLNITLMFGGKLCIGGNVSWVETGFLTSRATDALQLPDMEKTRIHQSLLEHYEQAVRLFGEEYIRAPVPHGILEAALDMRGNALLEDMLLQPERAEKLLDVLTDTVVAFKEYWDQKCYGTVQSGLSLGSCSTTMLSAELVKKYLVERYSKIGLRFGQAFLCCCGIGTHHLDNFADIQGVRYVRLGWGTDLVRAAAVLKTKHIKAGLCVVRAAALSPAEIRKDVLGVLDALQPVDHVSLLLIHAAAETRDETVRSIVKTAQAYAAQRGICLKDTPSCRICSIV